MLDKEELIRQSEQLRILKNFIMLRTTGKVILINDLENLVEAMYQDYINVELKELEEIENA